MQSYLKNDIIFSILPAFRLDGHDPFLFSLTSLTFGTTFKNLYFIVAVEVGTCVFVMIHWKIFIYPFENCNSSYEKCC